jgi:hypothetical protein
MGNAARWHGYVARLGFGTTRIRNQINAPSPMRGKKNLDIFVLAFITSSSRGLSEIAQQQPKT